MQPLSAPELLNLWENGQGRSSVERALLLLEASDPETGMDALASLSIGQRDGRLLTLREWIFGPTVVSLTSCPQCGECLEQTFAIEDVRVPKAMECSSSLSVEADGYVVQFRLPNSQDLAAIIRTADVREARQRLAEQCILAVSHVSEQDPIGPIPESAIQAVAERMAQVDPQGDIQLALSCPSCSRQWEESFDILSFLWSELTAWSTRMLDQVHRLASAYGWREADILEMSPSRREFYLSMV
jgi:hypothetical protein